MAYAPVARVPRPEGLGLEEKKKKARPAVSGANCLATGRRGWRC
jgi:hypothetical protein